MVYLYGYAFVTWFINWHHAHKIQC